MNVFRLEQMTGGWFVGDFSPVAHRVPDCEAACKSYHAGDHEAAHVHRVATEITVIVSGRAIMNGADRVAGDIVVLAPGEATDFRAVEDTVTMVVKIPSVAGDKYPAPPGGREETGEGKGSP